jgi:hypothetical protein
MIYYRQAPDPPEIEEESQALFERWDKEVTDESYVDFADWADAHASKRWKEYMDNAKREFDDAKAHGTLIG